LDKNEKNDTLTFTLHQTEQLNQKLENEINFLRKELETQKDKCRTLEESLEHLKKHTSDQFTYQGSAGSTESSTDSATNSQLAKRLTAMEMKELNERQKADHAQRMYDEQRNILRQLENRNIDLENNMAQLNKNYLALIKTEQDLRQELSECVPKSVNEAHKNRIAELEKQENLFRLEVSRLRELTEITLYQSASLEFISHMNKAQLEQLGLIETQSMHEDLNNVGKLHRQILMLQLSEATAVRKLQVSQNKCKKLEAQLIRAEQKYDRDSLDFFNSRKEQISKISYLRSTIQDLRHKYNGSIPLKQQEKFNSSKEKLAELKSELKEKLIKINEEKNELEDKIAEYEARSKQIEMLKNAAVVSSDGTSVRFNEKFLDSFKKSENLRMINLKVSILFLKTKILMI
jgi:centrosomal protein CEP290